MNWNDYHEQKRMAFLAERAVFPLYRFTDEQKINLAECGACCYHPQESADGWDTRRWLESINCVLHHGLCSGCLAQNPCFDYSKSGIVPEYKSPLG